MARLSAFVRGNAEYFLCLLLFYWSVCFAGITVSYRVQSGPSDRAGLAIGTDQTTFLSFLYASKPVADTDVGNCVFFDIMWADSIDRWLFTGWYFWRVLIMSAGISLSLHFVRPVNRVGSLTQYLAGLFPVIGAPLLSMWLMVQHVPYVVEDCRPEPVVMILGYQPIWWSIIAVVGTVALAWHLVYERSRAWNALRRQENQAAA